jgi:hypothetical protein
LGRLKQTIGNDLAISQHQNQTQRYKKDKIQAGQINKAVNPSR